MTNKRLFPFYSSETKGRDAWCRAAYDYYLNLVGQGTPHARAITLAILEADADEAAHALPH